jgi:hypothetical protein
MNWYSSGLVGERELSGMLQLSFPSWRPSTGRSRKVIEVRSYWFLSESIIHLDDTGAFSPQLSWVIFSRMIRVAFFSPAEFIANHRLIRL